MHTVTIIIWRVWYNGSYTMIIMMAKPIRALELHYSVILTVFNNANYTFLFAMELKELLVNVKSTASCQTSIKSNITKNKNEVWKTVRLTSFKKHNRIWSILVFFKFVHPWFLFYLPSYLYLLAMFSAVFFIFHSICWPFPLFEFW